MKKEPLTQAEHEVIGAELYLMRDVLIGLEVRLSRAYPLTDKNYKQAAKLRTLMDRLRCTLEDTYARENRVEWDTRTYYPGSSSAGVGEAVNAIHDAAVGLARDIKDERRRERAEHEARRPVPQPVTTYADLARTSV